jgi:hypothetical protein
VLAVLASSSLPAAGCSREEADRSRAYRIEERSQRVGGPAALAEVGDYILENGRIRVAITQAGNSIGPGMFGGSLIDIDRIEADGRRLPGLGGDAFCELVPMVNLMIPGYIDDPGRRSAFGPLSVAVLATGGEAECPVEGGERGCAAIRVTGKGDRIIESIGTVGQLGVKMNLSFDSVYLLDPGADLVRVRTDFVVDNRYDDTTEPLPLDSVRRLMERRLGVFDVLVGDALLPPEDPKVWQPGFLAGDFLLFGKKVSVFSAGHGFDFGNVFQRRFDVGEDLLGAPESADWLVGVGNGVSYAYASLDGPMIVPIYTGDFTGVFTHWRQCTEDDEACRAGEGRRLRYERVMTVGRGDVASALGPLYRLRGVRTGTADGRVIDPRTQAPVSGAEVYLIRDPAPDDPGRPFPRTADEAMEANRLRRGTPGVETMLGTDLPGDPAADGSFEGPVPPGTYYVVVRAPGRAVSAPVRIVIDADRATRVTLRAGEPGKVIYEVFDETGRTTPAKLTFVGPLAPADPCGPGAPLPNLTAQSEERPLPLRGGEVPDRVAQIAWTATGSGEVPVPPGRYDLWISRGFEYSVDRRCVQVPSYAPLRVVGSIRREVDTSGWVAGDFHMHGKNSFDASTPYENRLRSAAAEGIEVFTLTDHDFITNIDAYVREAQVGHLLRAAPGLEVTTLETGHLIGFPLRHDQTTKAGGALDWTRRDRCLANPGEPDCNHDGTEGLVLPMRPQEIFDGLRGLGSQGPAGTLVIVPHPRDGFLGYFTQFGLNPFDGTFFSPGLMRGQHPLIRPDRFFSWDFDALELFNSKRYDMIRIPTVKEMNDFGFDLLQAIAAGAPERDLAEIHTRYARRVLRREVSEQRPLRWSRPAICLEASDCGAGQMCDPQRRTCVPEGVVCTGDASCPDGRTCSFEVRPYRCVEACASDDDCRIDSLCDTATGRPRCVRRTCAATEDRNMPCVVGNDAARPGMLDDWFRLLNFGVVRTGLGSSDSHQLDSLETGCPRSYVAMATDDPARIDLGDLVRSMKAGRVVATYGPFVELWVNDRPIGDTVRLAAGERSVRVRVRVQWPSWFDVDRIELYRSGELLPESYTPPRNAGRFEIEITDELPARSDGSAADAWYAAVAMGVEDGSRTMAPVCLSNRHPYLGFTQVIATTFAGIDDPLLQSVVSAPMPVPEQVPVLPYAVTNPVFVDADGFEGYQGPLGPPPALWE